jgi:acylglycerol lipase
VPKNKPSEKGASGPTARVLADMAKVIEAHLPASPADPPLFVMGHSMGGGQTLLFAGTREYEHIAKRVRGFLAESPLVAFPPEMKQNPLVVLAGRIAVRLVPKMHMSPKMDVTALSRDEKVQEAVKADEMCFPPVGTLEGLGGMLDRMEMLSSGQAKLKGDVVQALWIGHGTKDRVTSQAGSKKYFDEWCGEVKDKEYKAYEGGMHMLHADWCKEEFYKDVGDWILKRCGKGEGEEEQVVVEGDGAQRVGEQDEGRKAEAKL